MIEFLENLSTIDTNILLIQKIFYHFQSNGGVLDNSGLYSDPIIRSVFMNLDTSKPFLDEKLTKIIQKFDKAIAAIKAKMNKDEIARSDVIISTMANIFNEDDVIQQDQKALKIQYDKDIQEEKDALIGELNKINTGLGNKNNEITFDNIADVVSNLAKFKKAVEDEGTKIRGVLTDQEVEAIKNEVVSFPHIVTTEISDKKFVPEYKPDSNLDTDSDVISIKAQLKAFSDAGYMKKAIEGAYELYKEYIDFKIKFTSELDIIYDELYKNGTCLNFSCVTTLGIFTTCNTEKNCIAAKKILYQKAIINPETKIYKLLKNFKDSMYKKRGIYDVPNYNKQLDNGEWVGAYNLDFDYKGDTNGYFEVFDDYSKVKDNKEMIKFIKRTELSQLIKGSKETRTISTIETELKKLLAPDTKGFFSLFRATPKNFDIKNKFKEELLKKFTGFLDESAKTEFLSALSRTESFEQIKQKLDIQYFEKLSNYAESQEKVLTELQAKIKLNKESTFDKRKAGQELKFDGNPATINLPLQTLADNKQKYQTEKLKIAINKYELNSRSELLGSVKDIARHIERYKKCDETILKAIKAVTIRGGISINSETLVTTLKKLIESCEKQDQKKYLTDKCVNFNVKMTEDGVIAGVKNLKGYLGYEVSNNIESVKKDIAEMEKYLGNDPDRFSKEKLDALSYEDSIKYWKIKNKLQKKFRDVLLDEIIIDEFCTKEYSDITKSFEETHDKIVSFEAKKQIFIDKQSGYGTFFKNLFKKGVNLAQSGVNVIGNKLRTNNVNIFNTKNVIVDTEAMMFPSFIIFPVSTNTYNPNDPDDIKNNVMFNKLSSYFDQRDKKQLEEKNKQNMLFELFYNFYDYHEGVYLFKPDIKLYKSMFPNFNPDMLARLIKDDGAGIDDKIYKYFKSIDENNLFEKNNNQIPLNIYSNKNMFFHMNVAYSKDDVNGIIVRNNIPEGNLKNVNIVPDKKVREAIFIDKSIDNFANVNRANFLKQFFKEYYTNMNRPDFFSTDEINCYNKVIKKIAESWDNIIEPSGKENQAGTTRKYMDKIDIIGIINKQGEPEYALIIRDDDNKQLYKIIQRIKVKKEEDTDKEDTDKKYMPLLIEDFDANLVKTIRDIICAHLKKNKEEYKAEYKDDIGNDVDTRLDYIHFFRFDKNTKNIKKTFGPIFNINNLFEFKIKEYDKKEKEAKRQEIINKNQNEIDFFDKDDDTIIDRMIETCLSSKNDSTDISKEKKFFKCEIAKANANKQNTVLTELLISQAEINNLNSEIKKNKILIKESIILLSEIELEIFILEKKINDKEKLFLSLSQKEKDINQEKHTKAIQKMNKQKEKLEEEKTKLDIKKGYLSNIWKQLNNNKQFLLIQNYIKILKNTPILNIKDFFETNKKKLTTFENLESFEKFLYEYASNIDIDNKENELNKKFESLDDTIKSWISSNSQINEIKESVKKSNELRQQIEENIIKEEKEKRDMFCNQNKISVENCENESKFIEFIKNELAIANTKLINDVKEKKAISNILNVFFTTYNYDKKFKEIIADINSYFENYREELFRQSSKDSVDDKETLTKATPPKTFVLKRKSNPDVVEKTLAKTNPPDVVEKTLAKANPPDVVEKTLAKTNPPDVVEKTLTENKKDKPVKTFVLKRNPNKSNKSNPDNDQKQKKIDGGKSKKIQKKIIKNKSKNNKIKNIRKTKRNK